MKLSQFKFKLPEERIAKEPTFHRDDSKLMVVHRQTGEIEHKLFKEVLDYFDEGDACSITRTIRSSRRSSTVRHLSAVRRDSSSKM